MEKVEAEKAVELYKPDKPDKILITLWKDGRVTACYKKDTDIQCCYTSSQPTPELYYIWQAFFTSPEEKFGYRLRELHRGEAGHHSKRKGELITCPYCGTKFPHSGRPELQVCPKCGAKLLV